MDCKLFVLSFPSTGVAFFFFLTYFLCVWVHFSVGSSFFCYLMRWYVCLCKSMFNFDVSLFGIIVILPRLVSMFSLFLAAPFFPRLHVIKYAFTDCDTVSVVYLPSRRMHCFISLPDFRAQATINSLDATFIHIHGNNRFGSSKRTIFASFYGNTIVLCHWHSDHWACILSPSYIYIWTVLTIVKWLVENNLNNLNGSSKIDKWQISNFLPFHELPFFTYLQTSILFGFGISFFHQTHETVDRCIKFYWISNVCALYFNHCLFDSNGGRKIASKKIAEKCQTPPRWWWWWLG